MIIKKGAAYWNFYEDDGDDKKFSYCPICRQYSYNNHCSGKHTKAERNSYIPEIQLSYERYKKQLCTSTGIIGLKCNKKNCNGGCIYQSTK